MDWSIMSDEELIKSWHENVYSKTEEIDPDDQYYWESLAYGFFLGKGVKAKLAIALARVALGCNFYNLK